MEKKELTAELDTLVLKWGRFKSGSFNNNSEAAKTLEELHNLDDADVHKEKVLTCRMIDEWNGYIYNWWHNRNMTKEEAKDYVMAYDSNL